MGARYYDPREARFTQLDSDYQIGDLAQGNRYSYAAGNPVNLTDPTGKDLRDVLGAVSFGAGLVALLAPGPGTLLGASLVGLSAGLSAGAAYANTGDLGFSLGVGAFAAVTGGASASIGGTAGFFSGLLSFGATNLFGTL